MHNPKLPCGSLKHFREWYALKSHSILSPNHLSMLRMQNFDEICEKQLKFDIFLIFNIAAIQRIQFFAFYSKTGRSGAQSCITNIYKLAYCGHFKLSVSLLRPSEAEIIFLPQMSNREPQNVIFRQILFVLLFSITKKSFKTQRNILRSLEYFLWYTVRPSHFLCPSVTKSKPWLWKTGTID